MFARAVISTIFLVAAQVIHTFALRSVQDVLLYSGTRDGVESCAILARQLPKQVFFPSDEGYMQRQTQYWSGQQAELFSACRVMATRAEDVKPALEILSTRNQTFAVVAGGHSSVIGASSAGDESIVLDLSFLNNVVVEPDGESVWIGPGARWGDVYALLEMKGLAVPGARVAHVGVGGFVLGGGISWFANLFGWACDSVDGFEVVTPGLEILEVNALRHEDLFWALKGSLGAFGVVTRVRLPTVRCKEVLAGAIEYPDEAVEDLLDAFDALSEEDGTGQSYLSFSWTGVTKRMSNIAYLVDMDTESTSPAFERLTKIPNIHNGLQKQTLKTSADEISAENPLGHRRSKFTLTVNSDQPLRWIYQKFVDFIKTLGFAPDDLLRFTFQPLTLSHLQAQKNFFPLIPGSAPFYIISVEMWWIDSDKDDYFEVQMKNLAEELENWLRARSELHDFVYPNYAAKWQDPFHGVEKKNRIALERAKRRYDPGNMWRRLVPGMWHV
ncbi:Hypothetical protein R9X50_00318600 [Acrodontium crateriforme]|uniref:FAD-binding PCMH-type domain-containing protein n=1 Tax=Acrodontium crateriforme TaxID=150365 RepID=A0AAQ3R782_9PEZI|nr:Hypothetical protein R9X50_00318600 [Acrodontium crateriforme]